VANNTSGNIIDPKALVEELIKNAQQEANQKKAKSATPKLNLPAGYKVDPSGSNLNWGVEPNVPLGLFTYVFDSSNNTVGYVKDNKFYSFADEEKQKEAQRTQKESSDNFNTAQSLQKKAEQQFQDLTQMTKDFAQGKQRPLGANTVPVTMDQVNKAANDYLATLNDIKTNYEKSGLVQGDVKVDQNGRLAPGTQYKDPKNTGQIFTVSADASKPDVASGGTAAQTASTSAAALGLSTSGGKIVPPAGTPSSQQQGPGGGGGGAGGKGQKSSADKQQAASAAALGLSSQDLTEANIDAQKQNFAAKYGAQAALINSVPELSNLLSEAIAGKWNSAKWQLAYQNSDWFQSHASSFRDYETTRLSDHGAFVDQYNNLLKQIQTQAAAEGIDVSNFGGPITPDQVQSLDASNPVAYLLQHYFNSGVPSDILNQYIAQHGQIAKSSAGTTGGQVASIANDLKSYAASMGVASQFLTPTWKNANMQPGVDYFNNAAQAVISGLTTVDGEKNLYKQQAMNIYKPFADQIDKGFTVAQLANPYTSAAANLLEISPESINLGASTGLGYDVTKALQGDGTNPMTLDQFTSQIKQRPEWLSTTNARNSLMDTATQLLRNFGMVVGG
jgi:hypothetical protein